jgi:hypothetical protein
MEDEDEDEENYEKEYWFFLWLNFISFV